MYLDFPTPVCNEFLLLLCLYISIFHPIILLISVTYPPTSFYILSTAPRSSSNLWTVLQKDDAKNSGALSTPSCCAGTRHGVAAGCPVTFCVSIFRNFEKIGRDGIKPFVPAALDPITAWTEKIYAIVESKSRMSCLVPWQVTSIGISYWAGYKQERANLVSLETTLVSYLCATYLATNGRYKLSTPST